MYYQEKDRLYKEQRSDSDKLSSEVKRLRSKNATIEAKCASQEEVIETLRHQIDTAKRTEKVGRYVPTLSKSFLLVYISKRWFPGRSH